MGRVFWRIAYVAFLAAIVAAPVMAWRVTVPRVRAGTLGSPRGFGLYALATLAPTILYLGSFFALVGIEELTGVALIAEEIGGSLLPVVAFGLFAWLLALVSYGIAALRARKAKPSGGPPCRTKSSS